MRRLLGVAIALAALVAAAALHGSHRERAVASISGEARRRAGLEARAAVEALESLRKDLEARATAAASVDKIKFLAASPDRATIDDALHHEPWWEIYRAEYASSGMVFGVAEEVVAVGSLGVPAPKGLVEKARAERVASEVAVLEGQAVHVAAAIVDVPGAGGRRPVVFLVQVLDARALASVATRAKAPVALWDGMRFLAKSGEAAEPLAVVERYAGATSYVDMSLRWAGAGERLVSGPIVSGKRFLPGLWLWAIVETGELAAQLERAATNSRLLAWTLAAFVALVALFFGLRPARAPASPEAEAQLRDAARQLEEARRQLERLTPPQSGTLAPRSTGESLLATAPKISSPSAPAPEPEDPDLFGRYRLVERIGAGGMGEIWTAVAFGAEGFKRQFVIKRVRPELAREPELVNQFIDEARLGARLVHSNVVPVFDFGKVGEQYFLAQEYIEGRDLDHLATRLREREGRTLPIEVVTYVGHSVLQALSYAHALCDEAGSPLGLVHRDVSPNNVLLSVRGDVKLLDFGIVKAAGRKNETAAGIVKGNVNCMSPEQAQGKPVDGRSDLFSLAMTLFRAASGEGLYGDGSVYDLLVRAATGPTAADLARVRALPEGLAAPLLRALQLDPDARFSSAAEFAAALPPVSAVAALQTGHLVATLFATELTREKAAMSAVGPTAPRVQAEAS